MKKNQNKLCYFFALFPPKFLHFCRMTHYTKTFKYIPGSWPINEVKVNIK